MQGARTPEELEEMFEDAVVVQDGAAVVELFDDGAVLAPGDGSEARGEEAIAAAAAGLWSGGGSYVGGARRILQARRTALVVAPAGLHVARRSGDGAWRIAIALLRPTTRGGVMSDTAPTTAPAVTRRGEGEARWWFTGLAEILLTAEQTGGVLSVVEMTEPPGTEAPLHVHHREDETFVVLEGEVTFEVAGRAFATGPGDVVFGPRDVPHAYRVGDAGCRMLFITTPGGFDGLVRDMSVPAASRTLPPPPDEEPDWDRVAAIAEAHGAQLLA